MHAAGRHLRHDGLEVRLLAGHGGRRGGHRGATTTQDFTLAAAPSVRSTATVRDSQRAGRCTRTSRSRGRGSDIQTFWTDPVTGYYDVGSLVEGITYTFQITAVSRRAICRAAERSLGVPPATRRSWFRTGCWSPTSRRAMRRATRRTFPASSRTSSGGVLPAGWTVINDSMGGNGIYPTEWVAWRQRSVRRLFGQPDGRHGPVRGRQQRLSGVHVVAGHAADHPVGQFLGLPSATIAASPRTIRVVVSTTPTWT